VVDWVKLPNISRLGDEKLKKLYESMPVSSGLVSFSLADGALHQFLGACQERLNKAASAQIISFSQRINTVDLLSILAEVISQDRLHFYWENCHKGEAVLGYGSTQLLTLNSGDRFRDSQSFVREFARKIVQVGSLEGVSCNPRFFCNFTFFDVPENSFCFPAATIFLPRFQIVKKEADYFLVCNSIIDRNKDFQFLLEKSTIEAQSIQRIGAKKIQETPDFRSQFSGHLHAHTSHRFRASVISALESIEKKHFSKIVLADVLDAISPVPFQLAASLNNLRQQYPNCYIFSVGNGQGNYFIGASPERLISLQNQQLVTDALAGSVPRGKTAAEDAKFAAQLLKSEKERREHQAVIDFIVQQLHQLNLEPHCSPLKILKLSNIQHLWTPIYARMPAHIHPLDIVAKLHPTPAVAGVPPQIACEQIRYHESFDRSLYAAPLGWVDCEGNGEFIVGIRSALIAGNRARLYAGAGIVSGSDPDRELAEIQLKFQTLLKALL
jgi:menaquinone-specific isochorismate synthase